MSRYAVVFSTVSSAKAAGRLSAALLEDRLVACASVLPGLKSVYRWKGRIETSRERLLILKTRRDKLPALVRRLRALHPYDVPEILALPVLRGGPDYLRWIDRSLKK